MTIINILNTNLLSSWKYCYPFFSITVYDLNFYKSFDFSADGLISLKNAMHRDYKKHNIYVFIYDFCHDFYQDTSSCIIVCAETNEYLIIVW